MSLKLEDKTYLVTGIANKKSIATSIAKNLIEHKAKVILTAQNENNLSQIKKIFPDAPSFILDVEKKDDLISLKENCLKHTDKLDGIVHSIAFANFTTSDFLATPREDFLQACQISAFSLVEVCQATRGILAENASVITVSISSLKATSYGFLGPVKAMLNSIAEYLAKSFSEFSHIRVNTIAAGPLKTSASAGIPDYLDNYLYAEALTLRKAALKTVEVAQTALFLLSPLSSGINGETLVIDAGMNLNYFDQDVVKAFTKSKFS